MLFTNIHLKQSMFKGIYCCSCSVLTIGAASNVISPVKHVSYFYVSTLRNTCAVPNIDVFLHFLAFALPWYVAQVLDYYYYY